MMPNKKSAVISENDLMMYLATGLKHLRLMALLLTFSVLLALAYYLFCKSVYLSRSVVTVRSLDQAITADQLWNDVNQRNIGAAMKGSDVTRRVAKRLGLNPSPSKLNDYIKLVRLYRTPEKNLSVEVYAYSYRIARDWAPIMVEEYRIAREQRQFELADNAISNYTAQVAEIKGKINANLDEKYNFQQSNNVDQVLMQLNELREVPRALLIVRQRLGAMDRIRESLSEPGLDIASKLAVLDSLADDPTTRLANALPDKQLSLHIGMDVPDITGDSESVTQASAAPGVYILPSSMPQYSVKPWEKLERDRATVQQEYNITAHKFLPGHPKMLELKRRIDEVDRQLELEFEITSNGFSSEYAILKQKQTQLERKLSDSEEMSRQQDKIIKEYAQLDTSKSVYDRYYNYITRKLKAVDFGGDKERTEFTFKETIECKDEPVSPMRSSALLYGILLGIALAIGVPFLIEYLNTRISDIEHAEETLRIRGLGVVPKIIDVPFEALMLDEGGDRTDHHLKENFRLIRTNLIINSENAALPQVILVTSSMPQEGKTSVAANLAISFASKGEKTLIIDGDLRRGRIYKMFGCPNKPGLSNVLKGEVPVEQSLHETAVENLTVMTCGKHLNSASELLDSHRFSNLMADLRGKYQRIILDTPPVLGLSETIIMQRFADGILLVIWSDFTPMASVKAGVQTLSVNGAKFLGFVLNRLDFSTLGNRYKYFYYAPLYYTNYQPLPPPKTPAKSPFTADTKV